MNNMRTCRACEGTGFAIVKTIRQDTGEQVFYTGRGRATGEARRLLDSRSGYRLTYSSRRDWVLTRVCFACSGTGRVSERIPASDAIADAETLALSMDVSEWPGSYIPWAWGISAKTEIKYGFGPFLLGSVCDRSRAAARAAFRAVPGLR